MKREAIKIGIACLLSIFIMACSTSDEKNAKLQIWLTDAPGDFASVNIDVQSLEVHVGDDESDAGWKTLSVNKGVYNLIDLTNGLDTLLGELELPAGKISQVRLKLGTHNSIALNTGDVFDLSTPSAQKSGLKLLVNETLTAGITYKLLLDFDVARSIVVTGNGGYKLKPVIRTITKAEDGAIKGIVTPAAATPAIYAILNNDTLRTTYADSTGAFMIRGLASGSYLVSFSPNSNYQSVEKTNVSVSLGTVTNMGTIEIAAK